MAGRALTWLSTPPRFFRRLEINGAWNWCIINCYIPGCGGVCAFLKFSSSKYEVFFSGNWSSKPCPCFFQRIFGPFFPKQEAEITKKSKNINLEDFGSQVSSAKHRVLWLHCIYMGSEKNTHCFVGLLIDLQRIFKGWLYRPSTSEELVAYFRNPMMKLTRIFVAPVISSCFSSHHYRLFRKQWEFLYLKRKRQRIWWFFWWDANEMGITRKFSGSFMLRDFFQGLFEILKFDFQFNITIKSQYSSR